MFFDFGARPPEVNSGQMYAGPGSGPMLAAASAWDGLAAELHSTAASYGSVVSGLTSGPWTGLAATSMAAAVAPYVSWLTATANQAEQTANQARAAAAAHATALAATVPPPVIAANRSLLMSLIATNILGQNTPAIAATEAHYAEMWAQDATAMYGYAGASSAASTLTPFAAPTQTTNQAGLAGQAAAVAQATALAASSSSSSLSNLKDAAGWATMVPQSGSYLLSLGSSLNSLTKSVGSATTAATGGATALAPAAASAVGSGAGGWSGLGGAGSAVSAGLGRAGTIGALSVPQSWAAAAPTLGSAGSAWPGTGLGAQLTGAANPGGMFNGMPMLAQAARGANTPAGSMPRFDIRPTVVPRPVAAG